MNKPACFTAHAGFKHLGNVISCSGTTAGEVNDEAA